MAKKTLNVGLIGYGMIGKVHAYATAVLPWYAPELDVVGKIKAVATSRMETARAAREQIGCAEAYDDYRKIIDNPEIDVVDVCVPNAEHFKILTDAIKAKKHIYCEKPIVASITEASALAKEMRYSCYAQTNLVAFHLRGFAALRRAKELIDGGNLGQLVQYRVAYRHSSMLDPTTPWRWKNSASGGVILDLASHLFDLVLWLVGAPATLIAQSTIRAPFRPTRPLRPGELISDVPSQRVQSEDSILVMTRGLSEPPRLISRRPCPKIMEYRDFTGTDPDSMPIAVGDPKKSAAIVGIVEATKLAAGAEDELTLEINGTRGSLRFSLMDPHYLEFFDATLPSGTYGGESGWTKIACGARYPSPESGFPSPKSTTGWLRAHIAALVSFYRGIADGRVYGPDFKQAIEVQDVLNAVQTSAITNRYAWLKES